MGRTDDFARRGREGAVELRRRHQGVPPPSAVIFRRPLGTPLVVFLQIGTAFGHGEDGVVS